MSGQIIRAIKQKMRDSSGADCIEDFRNMNKKTRQFWKKYFHKKIRKMKEEEF